jgi:hypothetical protein
VTAAALLALAMAGCGSASSGTSTGVTGPVFGRVGDLQILRAYLPHPASPSVAAVYPTVSKTGATADKLVPVSFPGAARPCS